MLARIDHQASLSCAFGCPVEPIQTAKQPFSAKSPLWLYAASHETDDVAGADYLTPVPHSLFNVKGTPAVEGSNSNFCPERAGREGLSTAAQLVVPAPPLPKVHNLTHANNMWHLSQTAFQQGGATAPCAAKHHQVRARAGGALQDAGCDLSNSTNGTSDLLSALRVLGHGGAHGIGKQGVQGRVQVGLALGKYEEPFRSPPSREGDLVIIDHLIEMGQPRNHDRKFPSTPGLHDRHRPALDDNYAGFLHEPHELIVREVIDSNCVLGWSGGSMLNNAINLVLPSGHPRVHPSHEPIEVMVV